jgi:hypothetical protein
LDSRSATDGPGVLECEELPEFEDGIIGEVAEDEDGPVFPGPGPGLGPGPDELELVGAGVPSPSLERERDESEA